jgi:uncharacterized membrane protein
MTAAAGETPYWALSLAYWLHMLATIFWIGGLGVVVLFMPAARHSLPAEAFAGLLEKIQRRLDPVGWLSLAVLVFTGLFQMSANPNYEGFLNFGNRWALAILVKHLVFLGMIGVSAFMTWGVLPGIRRNAILRVHGRPGLETEKLQRREIFLLRLNFILGLVVLGLTALARAS